MPFPTGGLPLDILQHDWWVPGSTGRMEQPKFAGKSQWKEILTCTPETCLLWATRATQDHTMVVIAIEFFRTRNHLNQSIHMFVGPRTFAGGCPPIAPGKQRTGYGSLANWIKLGCWKTASVLWFFCIWIIYCFLIKLAFNDLALNAGIRSAQWGTVSNAVWCLLRLDLFGPEAGEQFQFDGCKQMPEIVWQRVPWLVRRDVGLPLLYKCVFHIKWKQLGQRQIRFEIGDWLAAAKISYYLWLGFQKARRNFPPPLGPGQITARCWVQSSKTWFGSWKPRRNF